MKIVDILEKDKDNLLTELAAAKESEKAVRVLENELDKLLLTYNEQCSSERERNAAAYMMQAVRLSLPLIDSVGDTKVWEAGDSDGSKDTTKKRINPLLFLFLIGGLVLCGLGLLPFLLPSFDGGLESIKNFDVALLKPIGFVVGGLAAMFIAGLFGRRRAPKAAKRSQRVEIHVDSAKVYRNFRNAMLSVDQSLDEIRSMERWDKRDEAGQIDGHKASSSELNLFSDLLAAAYSKDPDFALEKIDEIKYYLHKQQIEVVDYSAETARYFDMMPGLRAGTIRPAMVAEGKLLRKGVASAGTK
ncbi:MAG: hypothetical protein E7226_03370 [Clostridiales bacterium]|nr:hypothetical protein [Clostridiales bacterium]